MKQIIPPGTAPLTPYATNNVALAAALKLGNVPWFINEHGHAVGALNDYTPEKLREIDEDRARRKLTPLNLSSLPHADGVKLAFRHAIPGNVTYQFKQCPLQERIVAGFEAQSKYIAATDAGKDVASPVIEASAFALGAIVCQSFRERKGFQGEPPSNGKPGIKPYWMQVPQFAVQDDVRSGSRPVKGGTEYYGEGSYRRTEVTA